VPPFALALIAVAAVLHAGWNVLLKTSGDTLLTATRLQAIGTIILAPIGLMAWLLQGSPPIDGGGVLIALISGALEALYFFLLAAAYGRGDLSLVYPLARGSAPVLAVIVGVVVLGERLPPLAAVGVTCALVGIIAVARPWRVVGAAGVEHRGAVGFALATGATIAAYSAVDRVGVRILVPWLYGSILAVFAMVILVTSVGVGRRMGWLTVPEPSAMAPDLSPSRRLLRDGAAGVLSLTAYLLILFAYSVAPLAAVAPLRESAIVLAVAWGSIRLGEAVGRRQSTVRIGAAGLVVVGAVLVALGQG
jgi:drug/metabolite transporter (DMT)-like permease